MLQNAKDCERYTSDGEFADSDFSLVWFVQAWTNFFGIVAYKKKKKLCNSWIYYKRNKVCITHVLYSRWILCLINPIDEYKRLGQYLTG